MRIVHCPGAAAVGSTSQATLIAVLQDCANVAHYVILAFVRTFQSETLRGSSVVASTSSMVSMHASVTVP